MLDVVQVVMVHNPSIGFLRRGLQMAVVWNTMENYGPPLSSTFSQRQNLKYSC